MTQRTEYAFPMGSDWGSENGMTLRDYFAGQALAGICANTEWEPTDVKTVTCDAYAHADAMLESRK